MDIIPDLIDNKKRNLAGVLKSILAQSENPKLDVVTAFFNLRGLEALKPEIELVLRLRLLLGKEQEQSFVVGERLLSELESALARGETVVPEIKQWRDFLASDIVEIRRYGKTFCHGKAYIVDGVPAVGAVGIVGSSNFTGAGLTSNLELNAVLKQSSAVEELKEWFEALWNQSGDEKEEILRILGDFTRTYTPYEIYVKIIYEALRDKLDVELGEQGEKPSPIALADFQRDGYLAAKEILENYDGVMIADSVGLGKTFLALKLLEDYAYRQRQTALVICPAAVKETVWRPLLNQYAIPHEIVSMEQVSQRDFPAEEYARRFQVIVVDESHNFRNPNTNRWPNLFKIVTQGAPDKKVILLTATPVNNTVFDLYHQLRIITRDNPHFLVNAGIDDLPDYFKRAERTQETLYEVLEALAVRRSRSFIRKNYPHAEIDGRKIHFPERRLHTVHYSLKDIYGPQLYRRIADGIESLFLAPYQIDAYRRELVEERRAKAEQLSLFDAGGKEQTIQHFQRVFGVSRKEAQKFALSLGRQTALAHIMRVLYLKRLESSVESLRISLRRLRDFLHRFLEALQRGRLLQSDDYRQWLQVEDEEDAGQEAVDWEDFVASLPEIPAGQYDIEGIQRAVEADLSVLGDILTHLESRRRDDKLEVLKNLLVSDELRGRKVVVFSYFKDTARYLWRNLSRDEDFLRRLGHRRIGIVDSAVKPEERTGRIVRFAPQANNRPDLPRERQIDLLISTDVLSEGQNLQDAEAVVNYDLHWNPVRMVQRIGRLDRIGSPHSVIDVYNFFPEEELEEILGLLERLREKLRAINQAVGLDASILGEMPNPMNFNILRRVEREDAAVLDELEDRSELAVGEFLKQDLLEFLRKSGEGKIKRIPLGVGTGKRRRDGPAGFFAAFRNPQTGQSHWLFYDEEKNRIVDWRLLAIKHIRCGPSEPVETLPEDFDPRPMIKKLRRYLWDKIRRSESALRRLPGIQRQVVNYLRSLPPSAERNRLLQYFERRPLTGLDLKDLRRLWRERAAIPQDRWQDKLLEFAQSHPHIAFPAPKEQKLTPHSEEELECIAWVRVK